MKFNVLLLASFTQLTLSTASAFSPAPNSQHFQEVSISRIPDKNIEQPFKPNTVLYKLPENTTPNALKSLNALLKSQGLVAQRTLEGSQVVIALFEHHGREKAIANILKHSGLVEFAEPDYALSPTTEPNDPSFSNQWHHTAVNSPQAWDITTGSRNVLTAVCDTGFDVNHPDLANNLRTDLAYNAQDGSTYIYDANGHGTGTAGTLGAVGNNATGVAGVNWDVDIIPVRIAISDTNSSAYISTMATCIEYAADNGARVVNLSYGGIQYATIDAAAKYLRSKNGLLFMSAGNDGREFASYPDYTSFIGVGATGENNTRASFSSWGDYVDVTAPGVRILTTYPNNRYVYYSGTSFSSPLTAGIAALIVAANPTISVEELENALFSTAVDIGDAGDDNVYGHGLVDAQAAVNYVINLGSFIAPNAVITADNTAVPYNTSINFSATASSDDDGTIVGYHWDLGDGNTSSQSTVSHSYNMAGSYQVSLTVEDDDGLTDSQSINVQVTTELPVAVIDPLAPSYNIDEVIYLNGVNSYDNDGTIAQYSWDFGDDLSTTGSAVEHAYSNAGSYSLMLTVTDNAGAMNTSAVQITITDPFALNAPTNLLATSDGLNVTLTWSDNSANEDNFIIERGTKYRGKTTYSEIASVNENVESYIDTVPDTGEYSYRIKAINSVDEAISNVIKVTVDNSSTPEPGSLATPTNLAVTQSNNAIILTWADNSDSEEGFHIERGLKQKGKVNFEPLTSVSANISSFSDPTSNLANGTYVYRVQAFTSSETSAYSNSAEIRLK